MSDPGWRERHLRNVVRLLDAAALAMEARKLADETAAQEIGGSSPASATTKPVA